MDSKDHEVSSFLKNPLKIFVESLRLLTPMLWLFMFTMILANIAAQMTFPMESLYLEYLGATVGQIGLFFTLAAVAPLFFQIFGGWVSDRIGRLQAIAIGSLSGTLGGIVYAIAPAWQYLLIASVLVQLAIAFVAPSFMAFIAEQSSEETRGRVYGVTSTLFMVVMVLGPLMGGLIAQTDFRLMFGVAAVFYATAAAIRVGMAAYASRKQRAAGAVKAEKPAHASFKESMGSVLALLTAGGVVTWILISDGVRDIAFNMSWRFMPLYLEQVVGLRVVQIGMLNALAGFVAMLMMSPAGWISDKFGERVGIVGGFGLFGLGWVIFAYGLNLPVQIVARVFIGMGWGLVEPAYSSLISKAVPEHLRGTAFGLFATSLGLVSLPSPTIGAWLWDTFSPRTPFLAPVAAMLIIMPIIWFKFRLPKATDAPPVDSDAAVSPDIAVAGAARAVEP